MTILNIPNKTDHFFSGRGAQINPFNPYDKSHFVQDHVEGVDEHIPENPETLFFLEHPKKVLNKVDSPDVGMLYSINPYQGCEHGCVYCYARNTHNYWGFSAGIDFESRIIVKPEAPQLLEDVFRDPKWIPQPISISGNTDCYQPVERKMRITRGILEVCHRYRNPAGMITKNQLILRDLDILSDMAKQDLTYIHLSITSMDESLRRKMEPRTASYAARFKTMEKLAAAGVPVGIMIGPVIPGLTDHDIPALLQKAKDHGASSAAYIMVRLNGAVGPLFSDWIWKTFPDKAEKVLNNIKAVHQGKLNDSRPGKRMKGDGEMADMINRLFRITRERIFGTSNTFTFNTDVFQRPGQMRLQF